VKEGANPDVEEIRKLVSGSLKKAQADGVHPDPNLLSAFAENALPDAARKQLLQHLGGCSDCREILYLSMLDPAVAQKALSFQPNRYSTFGWRWGAVAGSITVVAVLFLSARHKVAGPSVEQKAVVASAAPASAQIAADKTPPELDQMHAAQNEPRTEARVVPKSVPEPKHMTAKPKTELAFDSSDQVHILPPSTQNAVHDQAAGSAGKLESNFRESAKMASEQRAKVSEQGRKAMGAIEVSAGAAPVSKSQVSGLQVSKSKDERAELPLEKAVALPHSPQSFSGYQRDSLKLAVVEPQWRLSANGAVQRSFNSGATWQNVTIPGRTVFRVVSPVGSDVWAGGNAGVLYHSADSGQNWVRVEPAVPGQKLTGDITHIEFSDALNGTVITADSEVWATSDGGHSWQRK
jgi:hypothetical protein